MNEEEFITRRLSELADRAYQRDIITCSDFLNLHEQSLLKALRPRCPYSLRGGFDLAERKIACFGVDEASETYEPPLKCVLIEPLSKKFSDELTHRDFLGSLMGLGIKREKLGDIAVEDNSAHLICLEEIAPYVSENLTQVRHTSVKCEILDDIPQTMIKLPEITEIVIPSERLDALISEVWRLPRSKAKTLCEEGRVFVDSALTQNASKSLDGGEIVSVRGLGRFIFDGTVRETKKHRLRAGVRIFK